MRPTTNQSGVCQLHSGTLWNLVDPDPNDVHIEDIAHGLALQCRFNGQTREFYSVAEHSVRVSAILPPDLRLAGLLHDAAEAYIGDVIRPLKPLCIGFKAIEDLTMDTILAGLGLPHLNVNHPLVKQADRVLLATEGRDLMQWQTWKGLAPEYNAEFYNSALEKKIEPWSPHEAEARFMDAYMYLTDEAALGEDYAKWQAESGR